jgi:hypothetical protein
MEDKEETTSMFQALAVAAIEDEALSPAGLRA